MRRWSTLTVAALLICQTVPASAVDPIVRAPAGAVQGRETDGVKRFLGIPYAQPPVGSLRWKAPQPMPRWSGTRTAAEFGPACFQPTSKVATVYSPRTPLPMSEDCLSLNIWSPSKASKARATKKARQCGPFSFTAPG